MKKYLTLLGFCGLLSGAAMPAKADYYHSVENAINAKDGRMLATLARNLKGGKVSLTAQEATELQKLMSKSQIFRRYFRGFRFNNYISYGAPFPQTEGRDALMREIRERAGRTQPAERRFEPTRSQSAPVTSAPGKFFGRNPDSAFRPVPERSSNLFGGDPRSAAPSPRPAFPQGSSRTASPSFLTDPRSAAPSPRPAFPQGSSRTASPPLFADPRSAAPSPAADPRRFLTKEDHGRIEDEAQKIRERREAGAPRMQVIPGRRAPTPPAPAPAPGDLFRPR